MVLTPNFLILQLPKPQPFWCSDTALLLQNTPGPTAVTGTDELDASELVLSMAHYDFIYPTLPWDAKEILSDVGGFDRHGPLPVTQFIITTCLGFPGLSSGLGHHLIQFTSMW